MVLGEVRVVCAFSVDLLFEENIYASFGNKTHLVNLNTSAIRFALELLRHRTWSVAAAAANDRRQASNST